MNRRQNTDVTAESEEFQPPHFASEAIETLPHQVEQDVQRALLAHPQFKFRSLVVRRTEDGVCLQGFMEEPEDSSEVCTVAQRVAGVQTVLNRLVMSPPSAPPRKG